MLKLQLERARRSKASRGSIIKLDQASRTAIRQLIDSLRQKLDELDLTEPKKRELSSKLNAFASEIELNLSRTEAFNGFVVELGRTVGTATAEFKPFSDTINRVLDYVDKGKDWLDSLPPWSERKKIEGQRKQLPKPTEKTDDDIPF